MIASKLILWHTYSKGVAFDLSEHGNHGTIDGAHLGSGAFSTDLQFAGGNDAVWVKPSATLQRLGAVRAQVRFNWNPSAPDDRRHNLVEGELAFALFVNPDGSVQGTILNALGTWLGAKSAPGVVSTGTWHTAEFVHDGISHCTLYVDGHVVAEEFSSPGPVRGVGATGLAIGHWPEAGDQYTLEGYISEVKVWSDDPERDAGSLIDDCCIDRAKIDASTADVQAAGLDADSLGTLVHSMLDIGRQGAYWVAAGDTASRDHALDLGRQTIVAYETGSYAALADVVTSAATLLTAKAPAGSLQPLFDQLKAVMAPLPGAPALFAGEAPDDLDAVRAVLAPWCLDHGLPPRRPGKERRPPPATDNSLDPDTDFDPDPKAGKGAVDAGDPGAHEQVPPPPDAPPPDQQPGDATAGGRHHPRPTRPERTAKGRSTGKDPK